MEPADYISAKNNANNKLYIRRKQIFLLV